MKQNLIVLLLTVFSFSACRSVIPKVFGKQTPLEEYKDKLEDSGLQKTPEGRRWLAAGASSLEHPVQVSLPYRQTGRFAAAQPRALALQFSARMGEKIIFILDKDAPNPSALFAELYQRSATGSHNLLLAADTTLNEFSFSVPETGTYLLKLQPQLLRSSQYNLSVAIGPSLTFPVSGKANVGSMWGDVRDGGKRSHEGIDIFAPKGTPAVAAADGFIVGVRDGGIGGKTLWLRPKNSNTTLYYAHLDEQLVHEGQEVKSGETIGLVGNTGNAATTPPHLHFGVYTQGGAVDPLPFVAKNIRTAAQLKMGKIPSYLKMIRDNNLAGITIAKNSLLFPLAQNAGGYIAELPDGRMVQASSSQVTAVSKPLITTYALRETAVYSTPASGAEVQSRLQPTTRISVLHYTESFALVRWEDGEGWVEKAALKG